VQATFLPLPARPTTVLNFLPTTIRLLHPDLARSLRRASVIPENVKRIPISTTLWEPLSANIPDIGREGLRRFPVTRLDSRPRTGSSTGTIARKHMEPEQTC